MYVLHVWVLVSILFSVVLGVCVCVGVWVEVWVGVCTQDAFFQKHMPLHVNQVHLN